MNEYKSLKELFKESTRGDGRKFTSSSWKEHEYFEPVFLAGNVWYGLDELGSPISWVMDSKIFKEWHPPKKTKKVMLYRPVHLGYEKTFCSRPSVGWHSDKDNWAGCKDEIVGWMTTEVEVEVDDE